ncbi:MAG: F0F1 ATP synthase subunit B [Opitutaceae bacterium]|jgi:F-type H+-transporting ATPase subunit b|nr:F0F1 ATP synthase subunit B [Opitutaceae bacterium]
MFSTLPVLAAAAGGLTQITDTFGINLPAILAQVVSFSVVAYVLWRFAFKPVLATMDERQQKIEAGLKYTEEMKAKLEATQQESAALIQQAQEKASAIIHETRQSAKEYLDKQTQEAAQKANDLMVKAQQAIELERRKMIAEARAEIASLVVVTTERVLAKKLSDAERASYNESAARELTIA